MLRRSTIFFASVTFWAALPASHGLAADKLVSTWCYHANTSEVVCDVRTDPAKQVREITATVKDKTVVSKYEDFDKSPRTTAWYFLIQQTANPKDSARAIERIIGSRDESRRKYGVATFAERLTEQAAIGATPSQIAKVKDNAEFKDGSEVKTNLFYAANEALTKLSSFKADRKVLVLFADGRSSSQEGRDKLVTEANKQNIPLFTVFMNKPNAEKADPLVLENLATETSGLFRKSSECKKGCAVELPDDVTKDFLIYLERGGTVRIASSLVPKDAEVALNVEFTDGSTAKDRTKPKGEPPGPAPIAPDPPATMYQQVMNWVTDNAVTAGGIGAAGLGALVLGAALMRRSQPQMSDTAWQPSYNADGTEIAQGTQRHQATGHYPVEGGRPTDTVILTPGIVDNPHQTYAWLQFMDADGRRIPISSTNVRIGRGKDNDIVLQNKTVHRQHAVITRAPDGLFSIHHLDGANVVVVNGRQSRQAQLNNNDMIELGEVRMRFFANG